MPTVLREIGFEFRIRADDHDPPHVHVFKAGAEMKISIGDSSSKPRVLGTKGMSDAEGGKALRLVAINQALLLRAWEKYHG